MTSSHEASLNFVSLLRERKKKVASVVLKPKGEQGDGGAGFERSRDRKGNKKIRLMGVGLW